MAGALLGRSANNWWQKQHWQDQQRYRKWTYGGGAVVVVAATTFALAHTEEDPITGRRKLILFDRKLLRELAEKQTSLILDRYRFHLMSPSDPTYKAVSEVMAKILRANQHLARVKNQEWSLVILNDPSVNAYMFPNGTMFVHTGVIREARNLDQLAIIIGHEIAHCVQEHALDQISRRFFVEFLCVLIITALNARLSLKPAVVATALAAAVKHFVVLLPNSRQMEFEADKVGMMLSARACVDVREGVAFWSLMEAGESNVERNLLWWLRTHPTARSRKIRLDKLLSEANQVRRSVDCPKLPAVKTKR
ncbi:metalloendopeptidase OMA1, mitochondrial-like [Adelges cooleyi]|nr:metalloendopeptidase OMA1, mitochondrial-like [Adelges cooleyi]